MKFNCYCRCCGQKTKNVEMSKMSKPIFLRPKYSDKYGELYWRGPGLPNPIFYIVFNLFPTTPWRWVLVFSATSRPSPPSPPFSFLPRCLALPRLALPCLALPRIYLALPCLALPCLALPQNTRFSEQFASHRMVILRPTGVGYRFSYSSIGPRIHVFQSNLLLIGG